MQNRRIIDGIFRSVGATPQPSVETNSIFNLVSHAAPAGGRRSCRASCCNSSAFPRHTRAIELVEPTRAAPIGLIIADRDPPAPLARNLFAMERPERHRRLIARAGQDGRRSIEFFYRLVRTFNLHALTRVKIDLSGNGRGWSWRHESGTRAPIQGAPEMTGAGRPGTKRRRARSIAAGSAGDGAAAADPARLQNEFGYIDDAAVPLIAEALNVSQGRGPRRRQLLPRLPPRAGRGACSSCAAPKPARRAAARISSRISSRARPRGRPTPTRRAAARRDRLLPRQLRALARGADRRRAVGRARRDAIDAIVARTRRRRP